MAIAAVLDASVLLAFLHEESGGERVSGMLEGALVSTVNWSEVLQKSLQRNVDIDGMHQDFTYIGVRFEPFTHAQAEIAARLLDETRHRGLSLADRACLALALDKGLPVVTADRAWGGLGLAIEVELIR